MKYLPGVILVWLVVARPLVGDEGTLAPYPRQVEKQVALLDTGMALRLVRPTTITECQALTTIPS